MDEYGDQRPGFDRTAEPAAVGEDRGREGLYRIPQRAGLRDQAGEYVRIEGAGVVDTSRFA